MPNFFETIKQREIDLSSQKNAAINSSLESKQREKFLKENKASEIMESAITNFKNAVKLLHSTMCTNESNDATKALRSLISQSELIVGSKPKAKKINNLTKIITWANDSLNGECKPDDKTLDILGEEIKKESFFDKKINRVVAGIIAVVAAIVLPLLLWPLGLSLLATGIAGAGAHFLGMGCLMLSIASVGLAVGAVYNSTFGLPSSVGNEVKQLSTLFELSEPKSIEKSNEEETINDSSFSIA